MSIKCPIPKILIPVDGSENSNRAVEFAGCLGSLMGKSLSGVTLLRVISGSYLGRHLNYIDFRADILKQSDTFKRIKKEHIEKNIMPFLNKAEDILKENGIETKINKIMVDGDPAEEIVRTASDGNFSTIIMSRKGVSDKKENYLGSVTNKVFHTLGAQTLYIVCQEFIVDKACPIPKILVLIDGSPYSMKGVEHAAFLAGILKDSIAGVTLFNVINVAHYEKRVLKGQNPEKESQGFLDDAKNIFIQSGVPEKVIIQKKQIGRPIDEILKEIEEGGYTLVVIGRKGRSAIRDYIMGGVCPTVIDRCQQKTIAIVGGNN